MAMEHLLAVTRVDGEDNPLLKDFLKSLPAGSKKLLESIGHTGSLEENIGRQSDFEHGKLSGEDYAKSCRLFRIFELSSPEDWNRAYYSTSDGLQVFAIPDRLLFNSVYFKDAKDIPKGKAVTEKSHANIKEMLEKYDLPLSYYLSNKLKDPEFIERMTKPSFFSGEKKLVPTHISVGLEIVKPEDLADLPAYLVAVKSTTSPYKGLVSKLMPD